VAETRIPRAALELEKITLIDWSRSGENDDAIRRALVHSIVPFQGRFRCFQGKTSHTFALGPAWWLPFSIISGQRSLSLASPPAA
jgi:hypothetical protein